MWRKNLFLTTTFIGGYYILSPHMTKRVYSEAADDTEQYIQSPKMQEKSIGTLHTNTLIHWKLLKLAKSKNRSDRHKAVRSLGEMSLLQDWQCRMVAQACDSRTAVGLARIPGIKESYFLPPPFKDLSNDHLKQDLYQLLLSLPDVDSYLCLKELLEKIKSVGEKISPKPEDWMSGFEDSVNVYHSEGMKKIAFEFDKLCLKALLIHSAIESHRDKMNEKGILKMLLSVLKVHTNDNEFISLIGRIIANFTMDEKYEFLLHRTGWIGILASWAQSPNITVSLPAAKALANLDRDDFYHSSYENEVYLLYPHTRQRKNICADVIFVHGIWGGTFWTWRQHDSQNNGGSPTDPQTSQKLSECYTLCWPKDWLPSDIPDIRMISVDYNTRLTEWGALCPQDDEKQSLDAKASQMMNKLVVSNIGQRPIIWITHSMGGLLVKQLIQKAENSQDSKLKSIASNTKGVVFLSVPHQGCALAKLFNSAALITKPSVDVKHLNKGSPVLLNLHERFKEIAEKYKISVLSFGETKKSKLAFTSSILVTKDSSDPGFGEFYTLDVDHLSTSKPNSQASNHYLKILKFIKENVQ